MAGTRITLLTLLSYGPEVSLRELCEAYPTLSAAQIVAALRWAKHNRGQILGEVLEALADFSPDDEAAARYAISHGVTESDFVAGYVDRAKRAYRAAQQVLEEG